MLDAPESEWRKVGKLPEERAVGYGVSLSTPEGILCIGGADADEAHDRRLLFERSTAISSRRATCRSCRSRARICAGR